MDLCRISGQHHRPYKALDPKTALVALRRSHAKECLSQLFYLKSIGDYFALTGLDFFPQMKNCVAIPAVALTTLGVWIRSTIPTSRPPGYARAGAPRSSRISAQVSIWKGGTVYFEAEIAKVYRWPDQRVWIYLQNFTATAQKDLGMVSENAAVDLWHTKIEVGGMIPNFRFLWLCDSVGQKHS